MPGVTETEGTGRAVRGAHAKTFGVVKAEVEIASGLAVPYAQGIYATPGRHGALIRFSSSSNQLGPDLGEPAPGAGEGVALRRTAPLGDVLAALLALLAR